MILTGDNAQFALPEIGLGMLPGAGGTQRLARLVGQQLTMRWAMTGEMISAQTALQHGMSSQVCPTGLTVQYALELAEKIAKQAPLAIRAIKQSLKSIHEVTLSQGLKLESMHFYKKENQNLEVCNGISNNYCRRKKCSGLPDL